MVDLPNRTRRYGSILARVRQCAGTFPGQDATKNRRTIAPIKRMAYTREDYLGSLGMCHLPVSSVGSVATVCFWNSAPSSVAMFLPVRAS